MGSTTVDRGACWQRAMSSLGQLPPFSPILNRLMAELAYEAVAFSKLAQLIEGDTVLASNVLRVVNSPLYGLRSTVSSVRHAISVMGLSKLRNVVLSLSVSQLWRQVRTPAGWSMSRFNQHAVAVATLADLAALETDAEYAEGAFTAGLLHDIGKLLIAVALPDECVEIARLAGPDWRREAAFEEAVLGLTHADLSAAALSRWNLPAPIAEAVGRHHAPPAAAGRTPLARVLYVADQVAYDLGHACRPGMGSAYDPASSFAEIGLAEKAPVLLAEFQSAFEAVRQFF